MRRSGWACEPRPWRLAVDCGGVFTMRTVGGGIFQALRGFRPNAAVQPSFPWGLLRLVLLLVKQ
uniref:Uncharacterized protein n=1 Tax=Phocoena sinus TaxID=42100 RepID=A0A8C9B1E5_PHOSS